MLELRGTSKSYGRREVLHETSLQVRRGEICGYLGPNGSGKSTTVQLLTGLLPPTRGQVLLDGRPIADDLTGYKRLLGYVPEEGAVYRHLSAWEYLELVGGLRGIPPAELATRARALLEAFAIAGDADVLLDEYSKGMRQKILLAAALLHDPEILILDEPFSGLDVTTVLLFRHLLGSLAARGRIILITSHELELMQELCDRVIVIYRGRIVADDRVANLQQLMALPTLEAIFTELTEQRDVARRAQELGALLARHPT
ncbi:MAG: ABC transporter ATP-binding protein [Terriglobales bacterium]